MRPSTARAQVPGSPSSGVVLASLVGLLAAVSVGFAGDLDGAREAVRAADLGMARAVADGDVDGFRSWLAADAVFVGGSEVRTGPEEIAAAWSRFLDPEDPMSLSWSPTRVWLAASGELAATAGDYSLRHAAAGGEPASQTGRYLSLWRRGADGRWRIVADGPLSAEEPAPLQLSPEQLRGWLPEFDPGVELAVERRHRRAVTAESGDLAYTVGVYRVRAGAAGEVREGEGVYLTLWIRGDGGWTAAAEAASPVRPAD